MGAEKKRPVAAKVKKSRLDEPGFDPTPIDLEAYFDPVLHELTALGELTDPTPQGPFRTHRKEGAQYVKAAKDLASTLTGPFNRFLLQRQAELNDRVLGSLVNLVRRLSWLAERWTRQERDLVELRSELAATKQRLAALEGRSKQP